MIVRDNERTIRAALESIRPWVDEMIVVDTGSTDATPEICRELGAQVYHFPWPDSFSVARNESLKHARGEWIFWMDSDDAIDGANGQKLRSLVDSLPLPPGEGWGGGRGLREDLTGREISNCELQIANRQLETKTQDQSPKTSSLNPKSKIENPKSNVLGYVMQVHCPGSGDDGAHNLTVVDHVKLFRNLPELRFEGRIHEQVLPSIRRLGGEVEFTDIFVVHAGADHSPETRQRKLARDLHLLRLELREQPDHPFTLFNLGMTYADAGRHRRAIGFLRKSLAKSDPAQSQVRKAYALLAGSYLQLGKLRAARRACREGLKHFANDPELLFRAGLVAHRLGKLDEAERRYLAALANRDERHFSSIDRGIVGFKARQNLAAVYTDARELRKAEDQWRKIVAEVPGYRDGWIGLVENLLEQSRLADAAGAAAELAARSVGVSHAPQGLLAARLIVRAKLAEARGDRAAALGELHEALALERDDLLARDMLCRLLFTGGDMAAAAVELAKLVELDGRNAAAQHNLGVARLQIGDFAGAAQSLETSLRLRPTYDPTRQALAHARQMLDVGQAFQPDARPAADGLPAMKTNRRQAGKPDLQEAKP